jgi:ABC-type antimicrobial peptide transport system permease subunit
MGTGAWLSWHLIPAQQRNLQQSSIPGPQAILVRTRGGTSPVALASLQQITATLNKSPDMPAGGVTGVLRPAEIVNYRSMGTIPTLLGVALALGAIAALMLTLVTSVRRRQHELALLKTFGFTRRQLASVVTWQATVAAGIGIVIGIPLGIFAGRTLWNMFAHSIHAVPQPTIPVTTIIAIGVGALVLANLVALVPGLHAARTRTAVVLQAE